VAVACAGDFAGAAVQAASGEAQDGEPKLEFEPLAPCSFVLLARCAAGLAGALIADPAALGRGARVGLLVLFAGGAATLAYAEWRSSMEAWLPPAALGAFVLPVLNLASKRLVGTSLPVALALFLLVRVAEDSYGWTGPSVTAPLFNLVALHQALFDAEELLEARYTGALRRGIAAREDTGLMPRFGAERAPAPAELAAVVARATHVPRAPKRGAARVPRILRPLAAVALMFYFANEVPVSDTLGFVGHESAKMVKRLEKHQKRAEKNPNDVDAILAMQSEVNLFVRKTLREPIVDYMADYTGAAYFNSVYEDHHATLGLEPDASKSQIKRAFRTLSLTMHPDKHPNDPTAARRFEKLQRANDVLTKKDSGIQYREKLAHETMGVLINTLIMLQFLLPAMFLTCFFLAPGNLLEPLKDALKAKMRGGKKPSDKGEDLEGDFASATRGRTLAAAAEARLMTGDCVWWAQQLAHADAATASGLGGGGDCYGRHAAEELGASVKAAGVSPADAAQTKDKARAEVQAALEGLGGSEARKALWEARTRAGAVYEALRWARTAALLSELRASPGTSYAGALWSQAEEAARRLATPAGDAPAKAVAEGLGAAVRDISGPGEREEFLVASLQAFQHRVGGREKSFPLPKIKEGKKHA